MILKYLPLELIFHELILYMVVPEAVNLLLCSKAYKRNLDSAILWRSLPLMNHTTRRKPHRSMKFSNSLPHFKQTVIIRWKELVRNKHKAISEELRTWADQQFRRVLHKQTLLVFRRLITSGQLLASNVQQNCVHPQLLFLAEAYSGVAEASEGFTPVVCAMCRTLCRGSAYACAVCYTAASGALLCGTCREACPGHARHPLVSVLHESLLRRVFLTGCLECGLSAVVRASNAASEATGAFVKVDFVCLSSKNVFRGVSSGRRREEALARMRENDFVSTITS